VIESPYLAAPGKRVKLSNWKTDDIGNFKDKPDGKRATKANLKKIDELQEVLYAQSKYAVLIVLQAMDAGGKDGTIDAIFSGVNPQGCRVTSFKAPSHLELSHDYLWRVHHACPARGMIGIFNRSHYEDVLIARVKNLVPRKVWSKRYRHINDFERMLTDEGTTIIKFYLHISKEEQNERMKSRLANRAKRWKFNPADIVEGKRWHDYMLAFEDLMSHCSTDCAPWYVVPADRKWYRNWVISDIIVRTMKKLDLEYPDEVEGLDQIKL
jgi:PPK2 family polyphosphate:nucleotide phosphotransferase